MERIARYEASREKMIHENSGDQNFLFTHDQYEYALNQNSSFTASWNEGSFQYYSGRSNKHHHDDDSSDKEIPLLANQNGCLLKIDKDRYFYHPKNFWPEQSLNRKVIVCARVNPGENISKILAYSKELWDDIRRRTSAKKRRYTPVRN